ncbi:MAG: general secretion pathway protein GspK [Planctomycetes bacterium]|nr:general secretion pathway protein GspK [Planctomycetota bacterium]
MSWILVLLTALAATLARSAGVDFEAAARQEGEVRAGAIARSGADRMIAFLATAGPAPTGQPAWRDAADEFESVEFGAGSYTLYYVDPADGARRYGAREESSKLNLNVASQGMIEAVVDAVLSRARTSYYYDAVEYAAAIVDYRDSDSTPLEDGAEIEYYATLMPPYEPKNAAYESLAELLLVRGIDERLLWGEDTNRNGRLDASEDDGGARFPEDDADGELDPGLADFFTVYSYDVNESAAGATRIDLNQTSREALQEALGAYLSSDKIDAIDRQRRRGGFQTIGQLVDVQGLGMEDVQAVIDLVTTSSEEYLYGLVNVSAAPREVLDALPGFGEGTVDRLLEDRAARTEGLDTIGWTLEILNKDEFRSLAAFFTARSYQFEIAAVGELAHGATYRRVRAVVDLARLDSEGPRFLHLADETYLGPVFSSAEREARE